MPPRPDRATGVYFAWSSAAPDDLDGPWVEARRVGPELLLIESPETLSAVYHALKWALPANAALIVTPVERMPKSRGLAAGTTAWLRARITRIGAGPP